MYCGFPSSSLILSNVLLSFERLAMSVLASVVSDGSPGSSFWMLGTGAPLIVGFSLTAADRVRARFEGGLAESTDVAVVFLCLELEVGAVDSSASSPDASREEGCRRSTVEDFILLAPEIALLRFVDPVDEGEDIV